jgi:ABC-type lipoprotein export system ATPase subunit
LNRARAEKVGFIFQQFHLIPYLTALENVMLAQYFHSMTDEQEALAALAHVGLKTVPGIFPPISQAVSSSGCASRAP